MILALGSAHVQHVAPSSADLALPLDRPELETAYVTPNAVWSFCLCPTACSRAGLKARTGAEARWIARSVEACWSAGRVCGRIGRAPGVERVDGGEVEGEAAAAARCA
jgi:hypothetical protein